MGSGLSPRTGPDSASTKRACGGGDLPEQMPALQCDDSDFWCCLWDGELVSPPACRMRRGVVSQAHAGQQACPTLEEQS